MFYSIYIGLTYTAYTILILLNKAGIAPRFLKHFLASRRDRPKLKSGKVKYWFHCASLGEYEMAIPLIEQCLNQCSYDEILITFFSPSGCNQAAKGEYASRCMYLPLDLRSKVKDFYREFQPEKAIFIRYDFWYSLIYEGLRIDTEFYLVNARFSENHFLFKWYGKSYRKLIERFTQIFTSDQKSQTLLSRHRINSEFSGDTRFDRVESIYKKSVGLHQEIADFKGDRKLLIVGSSWEPEESLTLKLLQKQYSNLAIIIAPHDLSRTDEILDTYSAYKPEIFTKKQFGTEDKLLILNTMGILSSIYQYADIAIIGGGYSGKLHNIIEPLVQGAYPCFGPRIEKFPEAIQACENEAAYAINDEIDFLKRIDTLVTNPPELEAQNELCRNYATKHLGATHIIFSHL